MPGTQHTEPLQTQNGTGCSPHLHGSVESVPPQPVPYEPVPPEGGVGFTRLRANTQLTPVHHKVHGKRQSLGSLDPHDRLKPPRKLSDPRHTRAERTTHRERLLSRQPPSAPPFQCLGTGLPVSPLAAGHPILNEITAVPGLPFNAGSPLPIVP